MLILWFPAWKNTEEYDFATLPVIEQSRNSVGSELHQYDHFRTFTAAVILIIWLWVGKPQISAEKEILF